MASSRRPTQSQSTRSNNRTSITNTNVTSNEATVNSLFNADARLLQVFEQSGESGESFDYTASMKSKESVPEQQIAAYLSRIQRGGIIQPHGCVLIVEETTFRIIAYSENAVEMLDLAQQFVPSMEKPPPQILSIGTDVRNLLTSASAQSLEKAAAAQKLSLMNPIRVHCKSSGKPFYAIVHRIDVGMVIDFEPLNTGDFEPLNTGVVQSEKLAMMAISRLQSLPRGDIGLLCNTVVENVRELTGYDRVMVYKFHEDKHGEVFAEIKRSDLEPYVGLHYPATDIPQAARFLFMQNRVRMICDYTAAPVKVMQSEELMQPVCLVGSTLRAPHGCHAQYMANMGSIASLVMAVIIKENDVDRGGSGRNSMKLWGLVVCHHTSPRAVPFPLRHACEFLMQAFGLQLSMELQLAAQLTAKHIIRIHTLLCDMFLRDGPVGIVTQSPSIMDLVNCDGAAVYYGGMCRMLGVTPTEAQIKNIAEWLLEYHGDSIGLKTDSLIDAGYPSAPYLGDAVCGMAAARIGSKDFMFWFRSHTAKELKRGGAKHRPDDKDDGRRMHPSISFKAFLDVVKRRSLPWENVEIDAIHSLQLILRGSFQNIDDSGAKAMVYAWRNDLIFQGIDKLRSVATETVHVIETATAPIFAVNSNGLVNGWNAKVAELTGLPVGEAMGKSLVQNLVSEESVETVEKMLYNALRGKEEKNVEMMLRTFGPQKQKKAIILVVTACSRRDYTENIVGACFVGQDVAGQKVVTDKFVQIQGNYRSIVQSPNPVIPPIFATDESVCCSEWNAAMEKVTGWTRDEVIGKMLVGEIFGGCCPLKDQAAVTEFTVMLHTAIDGQEIDKFPFAFFDRQGKYVEALLTANKRTDADGRITGSSCSLRIASFQLQQAVEVQMQQEKDDLQD